MLNKLKFKQTMLILTLASVLVLLPGCKMGPNEGMGTLLGAAGGGLLGSQFGSGSGQLVATGMGVFLGGLIGGEIGASMDRVDRLMLQQTSQNALDRMPSGVTSTWHNPNTGNYGSVTPMNTYQAFGRYCREYQTTITVAGRVQNGYGKACRQPDGSWQIIN
jgi:surface antigen